ncbi:hypothetical protein E2562_025618 [Oryza meyeriana var. granulata]|uniref:PRLI-interacting factor A n=1 Tax=Oryza meyeriana var. granulata TaxID=110450 RepID=A0A6G1FCK1_9ORYZ|nr:hypothetical protein E2562_025618 [Oryza meyeriana var. granulata]
MDPNQMMGRSFPMWAPPAADDPSAQPPPQPPFLPPPNAQLAPNRGWKRKNPSTAGAGGYQPPALGDLQVQNRAKARRWFKNHNPNQSGGGGGPRKHFFPRPKAAAPRNTTSFIIRAKRAGGIASLVSPCPVTPAVLPTPRLSPSREGLSDMAQAQWGVDGYGSMKGLIRLRSSPHPANPNASDDDDDANSSGSDVEEHVEVERRLDHDLSRFEMVYPGSGDDAGGYVFEEEDEYDQDAHVARLEEENLTLKERLFLMEQELGDMRRRLEALESRFAITDGVAVENADAVAVEEAQDDKEMADPGARGSAGHTVQRDDLRSDKSRANNTEIAEVAADSARADKASAQDNAEVANATGSERSAQDNAEIAVAGPEGIGEEIRFENGLMGDGTVGCDSVTVHT